MVTQNIKLNVKLNLPDMKAFDKMIKTGINSVLKVIEPIPIVFNIEKSLEQAIEFFDKTIEHMSDKISEEVSDETVNLANIFENFTRRAVVGIGIITTGFFGLENFLGLSKNSITTIATSTNHLFAEWVENSERLFKTLGKFLSRLSFEYSYFMQGIGKSISSWSPMIGAVFDNLSVISEELVKKIASIVNLMNSIDYSWFVKTVTSLLGVTVEVNSTISYFLFFITKFSAWSLLVTSIGIGLKTLKRAWSFMFTSDEGSPKKALHGFMTYASTIGEAYKIKVTTFKHIFHSAVFTGAALFTSQFAKAFSLTAIFAGLAAQSFMSLIGNAIKRASLRTQSFMGSSRAQILMIALNMKDILYTVSNIGYAFMQLDPKKKMDMLSTIVAKFIVEVVKKIQKEFDTSLEIVKTKAFSALGSISKVVLGIISIPIGIVVGTISGTLQSTRQILTGMFSTTKSLYNYIAGGIGKWASTGESKIVNFFKTTISKITSTSIILNATFSSAYSFILAIIAHVFNLTTVVKLLITYSLGGVLAIIAGTALIYKHFDKILKVVNYFSAKWGHIALTTASLIGAIAFYASGLGVVYTVLSSVLFTVSLIYNIQIKFGDAISKWAKGLWESIKYLYEAKKTFMFIGGILATIASGGGVLLLGTISTWQGLIAVVVHFGSTLVSVSSLMAGIFTFISNNLSSIFNGASKLWGWTKSFFGWSYGWISKIFGNIFGGIWSGITTIFSSFKSVFGRADPVQKTKTVLGQIFTVVDGYIQKIVSRIIKAIAKIKMPAKLNYNVGPQIKPNIKFLASASEVAIPLHKVTIEVHSAVTNMERLVNQSLTRVGDTVRTKIVQPLESIGATTATLSTTVPAYFGIIGTSIQENVVKPIEAAKEALKNLSKKPYISKNLNARRISEGFVNQLIEGLKKDFPKLNVPLEALLNSIMKYFPQSPAEKGPLKKLAYSGAQIPVQLALGIAKNAKVVIDAINKVVAAIKEPIDKVIPTLMLSERLGMSTSEVETMDFALKNFGSTASELEFILGRLSTNREALKGIGLDMAEIEKTSNPALTTFLLLSERLREVKQGTVEYGKILEAAGVTATSGLVNVMLAGNEKFQEFRLKALELGAITQKGQQENAKQAHELEVAWSGFTTGITNAFWLEVMPAIDALFEGLMEVFTKADANGINFINRLHAIARVIGNIAKLASKIIVDIVHLAVTEPEKAKVIFIKFLDALYSTASTFFGGLNANVKVFLYSLVNLVLNIAWSFLKTLWTLIKTTASIAGKDISISFASSIIDTFAGYASSEKGMGAFSALYDYFGGARMRELQFAMLETVYDSQTQAENTFSKIMTDLGTEVKKDFEGTGDAIAFLNESMANTGNMSENISQAFKKAADEFSKFAIEVKGTPLEASVNDLLKGLYEIPTAYEQATAAHVTATKRLRQDIEKSNKVIADGVKEPAKVLDGAVDETQKKMASLVVDSMQKFGEVLDNIYKASNEKLKAIFYLQKGMAIATATVQGALAVINAYNDLSVPSVIMRTINAAMIAAKVASQIAVMTAETLGFNSGGKVGDAVGPNKDSIPAMLTSGEFVLNRSAVAKYGEDFLYGLNSLKFNTYRNLGGSVPTVSTPTIQPQKQPPINITNVNYVDKDEFGKFLATTHGQNMIINIISNNRTTVKRIIG